MYVTDIYNLFRSYIDESDATFISDVQAQLALRSAYDTYGEIISQLAPKVQVTAQSYTLSNASSLDLASTAPAILGSAPAAPRLLNLLDVLFLDPATSRVTQILQGVSSFEELLGAGPVNGLYVDTARYFFSGDVIIFAGPITKTVGIVYRPYPSKPENASGIDWTKTAPADTQFVDNFPQFHKLIAMIAAQEYYEIRDGGSSATLERAMARVKSDMERYFISRDNGADHRVNLVW